MGGCQIQQPMLRKEGFRPPTIVHAVAGTSFPFAAAAQEVTQPLTDECIEPCENPRPAVLKVIQPAAQHAVESGDDPVQAHAGLAGSKLPDFLFHSGHRFLAHPVTGLEEVVTQKVKTGFVHLHKPRFGGVQC